MSTEKSVYLLTGVYEHEAEITYRPLKCEPGLIDTLCSQDNERVSECDLQVNINYFGDTTENK